MSFDCSTLRIVWKVGSSIFLLPSLLPLQEISAQCFWEDTIPCLSVQSELRLLFSTLTEKHSCLPTLPHTMQNMMLLI